MEKVRSADGTEIAFDRLGDGPPVVLVSGASCTRTVHAPLAELLAAEFTVLNHDRRGRGGSGDTAPYAVEREIEDLDALIGAAGGSAALFGNSSGAVLALRAAAAGLPVTRLALWEPPFMLDPDAPRRQWEYASRLAELLGAGRRGDAMALFMATVGLPGEMVEAMRRAPMWPELEALAHTLAYDAAVMGDGTLPPGLVSSVKAPVLVLHGTGTGSWTGEMARALTAALPDARSHVLEGQSHDVDWEVLAPALREFLPG
ncbi:alpha/beta hydrolase [Planomonospora parontospora subsp. parontospora]|uniref:Alpha/beta hydrolase n=2 Tax=Planomonospora parontospora TaxID=58119 RepID=A0AA37BHS6_9ACTN|nr:alpha/beta hydrolase [Planomonospora parontospora]GGK72767.1 alpha/beta hydrolase [Planomonospora parontospora]GII09315.1 alpha/beta hydrolase [Planomonospora parontospora subsp. parontospora]